MRVNDIAKELGIQNKELISFFTEKGFPKKSHMSSVSEEEAEMARRHFAGKNGKTASQPKQKPESQVKNDSVPVKTVPHKETAEQPAEKPGAEKAPVSGKAADEKNEQPRKKKFTAVFRPQNAQQIRGFRSGTGAQKNGRVFSVAKPSEEKPAEVKAPEMPVQKETRPQEQKPEETPKAQEQKAQEQKPQEAPKVPKAEVKAPEQAEKAAPEQKPETGKNTENSQTKEKEIPRAETAPKAAASVPGEAKQMVQTDHQSEHTERTQQGGYQGNRTSGGYQGNRTSGGYQGNRTPGGYQGNRTSGGYQGNRTSGGYQGNRTSGGYQGNRTPGSYQGNRTPGSYQGNRTPGSYQGNRTPGSYQGNRTPGSYQGNRMPGSYQGNRTTGGYQGNRTGGYQGNRTPGGYQGNRTGGFQGRPGGGYGQRTGSFAGKDNKPSDGPLVKKTTRNRPNKSNYKDRNDKRLRTEDGVKIKTGKITRHPFIMPEKPREEKVEDDIKEIIIPETITIKDLAKKMKLNSSDIIGKLFKKGELYTINSELSFEQAEEVALEYDVICTKEKKVDVIEELLKEDEEDPATMTSRPPVVCVMGHVDHGKTSLLDAIRKTSVSSHEAGGITQHIGAYMVKINGRQITFLDTPGHEAFTAMRMRGAQATDIAVLVVAADDGVMPQTIEAINHAKAAGVEIIVAINKIDKPNANIERVKQELTEYELIPEDWGGTTIFCPVSAKTKEGIPNLLEMILLAADVKELKADYDRKARGLVIEAELDKGRGPVATVLVQKGTLRVGDFVACGSCYGKVRAMLNEKGQRVKEATPSTPVQILGLDNVPNAGEIFVAHNNEKEARDFAATFIAEGKTKLIADTKAKISLDDLFTQIQAGNIRELPIIVKADVQGSVEAVVQSLNKLSNAEVQVKVIHSGVGAINESDVALAAASNAIIIGFNIKPDSMAKSTAEHEKVDIRLYKVIYQAIDDVQSAMNGMLAPVYEEKVIGHAEIRQLFKASGVGTIAGSYVLDGKFTRGCKARISRDGKQIFDGDLASLKRFKDDVKEVAAGYECGLVFDDFNDIMEGDQVEAYAMVEVPRK